MGIVVNTCPKSPEKQPEGSLEFLADRQEEIWSPCGEQKSNKAPERTMK